jgi:hypothetical protein
MQPVDDPTMLVAGLLSVAAGRKVGIVSHAVVVFSEWRTKRVAGRLSGTIAAIVAPWFLISFIVSPLSRLVYVLHGRRLKLIYDILIFGGNLIVFVFCPTAW